MVMPSPPFLSAVSLRETIRDDTDFLENSLRVFRFIEQILARYKRKTELTCWFAVTGERTNQARDVTPR